MNFIPTQLQAIGHYQENLQLISCAGSGKTEVVVRRVANLLKNGLTPRHIVVFTFINKAAAELKEHIISRRREELGEIHGMAEMYVGTIHTFCLELLKNELPIRPIRSQLPEFQAARRESPPSLAVVG